MENQKKSYLFAFTAILFWSTVATSFKIALSELTPALTLFYSIIFSIIVLIIILIFQNKINLIFKCSIKDYLYSALLGLLNPFIYYLILFKAYSLLPAQLAQPLNYTWPIVLVVLSAVILKQKLKYYNIIAILISFLGVIFVSLRDNYTLEIESPFGILLATCSSIFWALFWILNIKDKRDEIVKLFLNFSFGLFFIIFYIIINESFVFPSLKGIVSTVYIGIFETGVTFILWLYALKYTKSNDKISNFVFLSPFLSLIFINLILKESIYISTIIGLSLIIISILFQQIMNRINKIVGE